jgi:hypothetical protein
MSRQQPGILCKSLGFGVFAEIFSKYIMIPSREIPFFGEAPQWFWVIIAKFGFFGFLWMTRITKFGLVLRVTRITKYLVLWVTRITKYSVLWVTRMTKFGDSVFLVSFGSSRKFTKEEPAQNHFPFDDRCFTMMQTTAAFTTLSVPTPMVLLYIDSVMITYMKELHYGVFNNQSCAESDFSLSIAVQLK